MADTSLQIAGRRYDEIMKEPLRQINVGRKLFGKVTMLDEGNYNVQYDAITDMGDAIVTYGLPSGDLRRDGIKITPTNAKVMSIMRGYEIDRQQWNAYERQGKDLSAKTMMSAAYSVGKIEDDVIIQGWAPNGSTYEFSGLYQAAGNDFSTSADTGTFGNAVIAVAGSLALLDADSVRGVNFNWVLNPTQYREVQKSHSTTGEMELPMVRELLNSNPAGPKGDIVMSNDITAGTGLLVPIDTVGNLIELYVLDARNFLGFDPKLGDLSPVYGHIYELLLPVIYQSNCLCKTSAI